MLRGTRLVALSAALLLTGCTPDRAPAATAARVPSTMPTPAFSSKAAAFKAAENVYRRYLRVSARSVAMPKSSNVDFFAGLVSHSMLAGEKQTIDRAIGLRLHGSGNLKLKLFKIQSVNLARGDIRAYTCVDFSSTKILDGSGRDVTPKSRPSTRSSVATFVSSKDGVLLNSQSSYEGDALC